MFEGQINHSVCLSELFLSYKGLFKPPTKEYPFLEKRHHKKKRPARNIVNKKLIQFLIKKKKINIIHNLFLQSISL